MQASRRTDILLGMRCALEVLRSRRYSNSVTSIFLLSDGQDVENPEVADGKIYYTLMVF